MNAQHTSVLVVGGGMAGVTAAVESAELGRQVYLVEKTPSLGGRVAGMRQYFPKLCPPYCGLEINYRRIKENPRISVFTLAEVTKIEGQAGDYAVTVKITPRYVKEDLCNHVTSFAQAQAEVPNPFNYGMDNKKVVQIPHELAYPFEAVVDAAALEDDGIRAEVEKIHGVDLDQEPKEMTLKVGAIIWATGWQPYDADKLTYLGYDKYPDVIANVEMERLCAVNGPTRGKLVRPSDGREAKRVAFIQCAGSRDENHLPYCSSVCCMASLKQTSYVREAYEDAQAWVFYIDIRATKYEAFYRKVQDDEKIHFVKGKPSAVEQDPQTGDLVVVSEDELGGGKLVRVPVDLVVLATGMVPATSSQKIPLQGLTYDEFGFLVPEPDKGVFSIGCAKRPTDVSTSVQDATGTSLKALVGKEVR